MRVFRFARLLIPLVLLCAACVGAPPSTPPRRVLFVGNSLTYVGNVPAVYSAIAAAEGRPVASDMIVRGGATLAQRVADGSVERALQRTPYTALVLQERGGDLMCSFGPQSCPQSREAIRALARLGRARGATVVLLGTYQPDPWASQELVEKESAAAAEAGIAYVEISQTLQHARRVAPELVWFASDGMHPGADLALLNAVRVYQALHGTLPAPRALHVDAPIYASTSGLTETPRPSDAPPHADTPRSGDYAKETLAAVLGAIAERDR